MQKDKRTLLLLVYAPFAIVAIVALFFAFNFRDIMDARPQEFSQKNMLRALWHQYKDTYLEPGTIRSLDKQQKNITTSEGQSYTMLRAVWMGDREVFDEAWQWTKDNLQRSEDHLLSWLFGERPDGTYGVLVDEGGYNTAADADIDIALSLVFASKRWNDEVYFGDAAEIIRDIWRREVVMIGGRPYLAANNVEKTAPKSSIIVNPSYFAPYAFKIFAEIDPGNDWNGLAETSYEVAQKSIELALDKESSAHLPPDWIAVDKATGEISAVASESLTTNYSFDALRMPWRFAVDYIWSGDPRAKAVLDSIGHLSGEWDRRGSLAAAYSHDGARVLDKESLAMYGGSIGYFMVSDPRAAKEIYSRKLERIYDPNESKWLTPQGYYDENWAWFGMALYAGEIRDLYRIDSE
jgi:endoglucanase